MTALVTTHARHLADALADVKVRVRTALATELARAAGTAVRDVLAEAVVGRPVAPGGLAPSGRVGGGRDADADSVGQDAWGDPRNPCGDPDGDDRPRVPTRYAPAESEEADPAPAPVSAAAAVAVGVTVCRWWLNKHGTVPAAAGLGAVAAGLGLAGGPVARAALAVLAAAADVLAAEAALARTGPS